MAAAFALAALHGAAAAQLLTPNRCANAFNVTQFQAQSRYAWANFCKDHPRPDAGGVTALPSWHYLTPESITYYNNDLDASEKSHLFPTYYDAVTGGVWDVPDGAFPPPPPPPGGGGGGGGGGNCPIAPTGGIGNQVQPICLMAESASGGATTNATYDCFALPTSAFNVGLCVAGCYTEDTALQFAGGAIGIKAAAQAGQVDLVTLAPTATLDDLQYTQNKVAHYVTDATDSVQTIYTLAMKSGGQLHVTSEHPLLTSDGIIRQAQGLRVGDQLVLASGKPDPIVGIAVAKMFGKVYNVKPVTLDYVSNIVVAEGYLNGSVRYQNEFLDTINSLILRRTIAAQAPLLTAR